MPRLAFQCVGRLGRGGGVEDLTAAAVTVIAARRELSEAARDRAWHLTLICSRSAARPEGKRLLFLCGFEL